ncbi:MAG: NADH-quinone oxidoreductase subunit J [Planctomycetota bacterium]
MAEILFYLLAAGTLAFGVGVVAARMPLHSVLSLLGAFFCLAGIYLLAGFQFLAATQLLVYAGAIMVLFLFVIMLLNLGDPAELKRHGGIALGGRRLALAGGIAGVLALIGALVVPRPAAPWRPTAVDRGGYDGVREIAEVLFSRYMLPFEAASLLLLATMIAVVALAKRQRPERMAPRERIGWPWEKGVEQ